MEKVGNSLLHLERALGIDLESLHSNDQFIDIALQSSHIALRTSHEMKLEALKNATLNSAVGLSIDDSMTYMFLGYLDSFAPWHLKLLKFFNSRCTTVTSNHNVGTDYFIENEFPELTNRKDFYSLLGKELHSHGLINNANFESPPSKGLPRTKPTEMGCEFLIFIKSPIKNETK
jgi:hypothetical protein